MAAAAYAARSASVKASYADRWVNQLARLTYDHRYRGAGNWPFDTAVGANRLAGGFVTGLPDLRTAKAFLRAGIPLEVSIRFGRGQTAGRRSRPRPGTSWCSPGSRRAATRS